MTSHHDVAGVVTKLRYLSSPDAERISDFERLNSFCHEGHNAADLLESQAKALSEAEANLALLSDPISVHINMCRGTIAKPSWENLRHLFPVIYDLEHAERRRLAAEARLAEAMRMIEPFVALIEAIECTTLHDYSDDETWSLDNRANIVKIGHLRAARAFTNAAKEKT